MFQENVSEGAELNSLRRDSRTDLLRLFFMYLICMVHAVGYVDSRWSHWIVNLCFSGVLGFVLISGYYGIRFSWLKVLKIEGCGIGCAVTVVCMAILCGRCGIDSAILEVIRLWKGYWFVHAYVVMMVLAGMIGESERRSLVVRAIPFVILVYGWSFSMLIPGVQKYVPRTSGLVPYSGITLFAAYLVGRFYRDFDWDVILKVKWVLPMTLFCGLMSSCSFPPFSGWGGALARYNSPFLLGLAIGLFWLARRVPVSCNEMQAKILAILTPSVLAVYLIHCNDYGYLVLGGVEKMLTAKGVPSVLGYVVLASVAFVGGFLFDIPRRLVVMCFRRLLTF